MRLKKVSPLIAITIVSLFFVSLTSLQSAQKPKIGIMKFDVTENVNPAVQEYLYAQLLEQMVQSGKYTVVDWEEIDRLLQYIASSQPNVSEEDARRQAVNQLGIEKMYLGSVAKIGSKYHLSVKVLNLDLSIDRTASEYASNENDLDRTIKYVSQLLMASPEKAGQIKAEKEAWEKIQSNKSEQSIKEFIKNYPEGVYAKSAKDELDKVLSVKKKKESIRKAKKDAEIEARKKQEERCNNIAGPWEIISEKDNQYNKIILIPSGRVVIHQNGEVVSFDHLWKSGHGGGDTTYSGTYQSRFLKVKSHEKSIVMLGADWEINAYLDDDCMTMKGTWECVGAIGNLTMKRLDANVDPSKYTNVNLKGPFAMCFISTLTESKN
jgi:hypothetical protein